MSSKFVFFHAVPTSPPGNISITVIGSTNILVKWTDIPEIEQNGIISQYEVSYEPLRTFGVLSTKSSLIDPSNLSHTIVGLEEYVEYSITVRAYTSVGPGPYSVGIVRRTFEDGKYCSNVYKVSELRLV